MHIIQKDNKIATNMLLFLTLDIKADGAAAKPPYRLKGE